MLNRLEIVLGFLWFVNFTPACSPAESGNVPTELLGTTISVVADGSGETFIEASLFDIQFPTILVTITPGDTFISRAGDAEVPLIPDGFTGTVASGTWPLETETTFTISFEREGEVDAPNSYVTLPPPFRVFLPRPGATLSRTEDWLDILWEPNPTGTDVMELDIFGPCIRDRFVPRMADSARYTLLPGALFDPERTGDCEVTVKLTRYRRGTVNRAFHSGEIVARQERTIVINSTL